jgi:hypothetical protein
LVRVVNEASGLSDRTILRLFSAASTDWLLLDLAYRIIDWSKAGVWRGGVKGIPYYPIGIDLTGLSSYGGYVLDPTGAVDSSAAIQAAINNCSPGHAVYLPEGLWKLAVRLGMMNETVLRGAGMSLTILSYVGAGTSGIVRMGGSGYSEVGTSITSGYTSGSTSITLSDASSYSIGSMLLIDELNDPTFVDITSSEGGSCLYCSRLSGTRALQQMNRIKNKVGNVLTLEFPLVYGSGATHSPEVSPVGTAPIVNSGVEDLSITYGGNSNDPSGIEFTFAYGCWARSVEVHGIPRMSVWFQGYGCGCEVRECYIHDAASFASDHGYGISMINAQSHSLVEDNIFDNTHCMVAIGSSGGAGNVVAYNYGYCIRHYQENWFVEALGSHGAHTILNLFEGNVAPKFTFDLIHGSGSHHMVFRNYIRGDNPTVPISNNLCVLEYEDCNSYITMTGNVIGHPGWAGTYDYVNSVSWCLYHILADYHNWTGPRLIRHGNYDRVHNAVMWDPTIVGRGIPDSLYLSGKPSWWDSSPWPPYTPERIGFDTININKIPAQVRFEAM